LKSVIALIYLLPLCFGFLFCDPFASYRSLDGSCNNLLFPHAGQAGGFLSRGREGAEYADGISVPVTNRPNERLISNTVGVDDPSKLDNLNHTMFAVMFGQFINHDLQNNRFLAGEDILVEDSTIPLVQKDDPFCFFFADVFHGNFTLVNGCEPTIPIEAGIPDKSSVGQIKHGVFQVFNDATAYLDLSQLYSPIASNASSLRTHVGGKLLLGNYTGSVDPATGFPPVPFHFENILPSWPQAEVVLAAGLYPPSNPQLNPAQIFAGGDPRVGENVALDLFHLLFTREHNRLAASLAQQHHDWSDEKLYQEARRLNIAQYQNIVLYQYFPSEFGQYFANQVGPYMGYDPLLEVSTPIVFSTAAFRYGHSSLHDYAARDSCGVGYLFGQSGETPLPFLGETGGPITPTDTLAEAGSYENVIRGLIAQQTSEVDELITDSIRNIQNVVVVGGADIFALDIHRGRLNGIPNYGTLRHAYHDVPERNIYGRPGCPASNAYSQNDDPIGCFNYVTSDSALAAQLKTLYGKVNRIDAIIGGLAESHAPGSSVSYTFGNIIAETYGRIRDGDRFWFENSLDFHEVNQIRAVSMKDLLERNFNVQNIPHNPFLQPQAYLGSLRNSCH